ncbi:hypothetical protein AAE02nite_21340 [Adhaeribacter aerolatus]|uniref:BT4734-like N-terminal domain-containing protein n=1 Tax=Adhaeribacter aerolatus TaxID=670289 RepID=A0A512AXQ3_9BACT|nr:DUF3987 domain-containing protein [Adhaeribacter aerolatus]GEO04470.1 hypothetical protein AAE02nite_21340 [Adhaeribacter aerolatus]
MEDKLYLPVLKTPVNLYKNATDKYGLDQPLEVGEVISRIQEPVFATITEELRNLSDKEFSEYKKSMFPAVSWSGLFSPTRAKQNLIQHSGLLCLDIDDLSSRRLEEVREQIKADPFTFISFISPSGKGIKVIVKVDLLEPEQHEQFFAQLQTYYYNTYEIVIDPTGKNVDRLCFLCYDKDIFVYPDSRLFGPADGVMVTESLPKQIKEDLNNDASYESAKDDEIFDWCFQIHNRTHEFVVGKRNHYLTGLINFCNDYGVSQEYCKAECISRFSTVEFTKREILATVRSIYQKTGQHGSKVYNNIYSSKGTKNNSPNGINDRDEDGKSENEDSPIIPSFVYQDLPNLLNRMCQAFNTDREKDTFLTGALVVLSGCFPVVSGLYDGVSVHTNLFGFIVAPAATGKGAMGWAKTIALSYHKELSEEQYFPDQHGSQPSRGEDIERSELDVSAAPKILFFPANSSAPSVISALNENDERGIIFESEADTLSATLSNDWGNYSDMLRKAFHHEAISYMRKTNNEYREIAKPQLSVCLSGTPGQVQRLIPNAEDGLFSRFIFYNFALQPKWRSVSPYAGRVNLNEYFNLIQGEVLGLIHLVNDNVRVNFTLQDEQWEHLDNTFSIWLDEVTTSIGGNAGSAVKRLGLITFRIAMILSILRRAETGEIGEEMECTETDFMIAMALAKTYRQHSFTMYKKMPQEKTDNRVNSISEKQAKYLEAQILKQFGLSNRKIAEKLNVTEGTIRNWFKGDRSA